MFAYKVKQLVTAKFFFFLHVLHYDLSIMRTIAVMLAADCCARHGGNGTRFA